MDKKRLHDGHRDRMRKRFTSTGINGMSPHEVLEMLLFYVLPRVNTNETAHLLIRRFGDLNGVLSASPKELKAVPGIGDKAAAALKIFAAAAERISSDTEPHPEPITKEDVFRCFLDYFSTPGHSPYVMLSIGLDKTMSPLRGFPGGELLRGLPVTPDIAAAVLNGNLINVIIGIDHGKLPPVAFPEDYYVIRKVGEVLNALEINFVDAVICGMGKTFSMREHGAYAFD